MELFLLRLRVLAHAPDPGSVRPLLVCTPIDAEFLGRRGDSSQATHGCQEIPSLGERVWGCCRCFTAVSANGADVPSLL